MDYKIFIILFKCLRTTHKILVKYRYKILNHKIFCGLVLQNCSKIVNILIKFCSIIFYFSLLGYNFGEHLHQII